ncbi:type VI secretion system contractile sheath small subunit [Archangium lansingense]|uniref:Type VI secretion system contractile sheath small subunit n=1 Tax=Archangium lansingense TaxID=2995310 RepID=A0ABT4A0G6_9BACT|nr:type VI secretion system contractile sheath small subunit [Archangium lansinium]MCY1075150.1 type VI secretion system contractile sheath small subunit [Archangium lansinium]
MPIQDRLPKSRITLTYRTNINGQEQEVDLPFRVLVLGNFSHGTSSDFKGTTPDGKPKDIDLDERKIRSVTGGGKQLDKLMADMKMSLPLADEVPNANPNLPPFPVTLTIDSMKSFHPDEIVKQVPQLRALRLLRKLLESIQSNIDNNKILRGQIEELYKSEDGIKKLQDGLEGLLVPALQDSLTSTFASYDAMKAELKKFWTDDALATLAADDALKALSKDDKPETLKGQLPAIATAFNALKPAEPPLDALKSITDAAALKTKLTELAADAATWQKLKDALGSLQTGLTELQAKVEELPLKAPPQLSPMKKAPSFKSLDLPQDGSGA